MIPPQLLAMGGGVLFVAGMLGGWTVRDWKADSEALTAVNRLIETKDRMQAKVDAKSTEFEAFRASIEAQRAGMHSTIERIYKDVQVPSDCALRPDALGVLERARTRANAAAGGQSGQPVPDDPTHPGDRP
jgi:hypothetical protein